MLTVGGNLFPPLSARFVISPHFSIQRRKQAFVMRLYSTTPCVYFILIAKPL